MSEFKRENRYIVIKRKDLALVPVAYRRSLVEPLGSLMSHIPHREYVVVESDWPEYETVWRMIEARVTSAPFPAQAGEYGDAYQGALPPFAEKVLGKLRRFYDCASDFESGGVDIGRHWLDLLTQLGLLNRVQRSPALWEISQQGEDLLEGQAAQAGQVPEGYALVPLKETEAMHDAVMALLYKGLARQHTQALLDAYIAAAPKPAGGE
ncbi:hypothetical protein L5B98_05780 [Pseudomonas aeruginosa]|nr:hypothetical protein [Pseudomonas aeruginosa]MDG3747546.1 hypothetical protein [Pseudomonas aeruginosa]MDG3791614.1 hypothetical protein [Pseudomonas aeruginosa]MDG4305972.1 hypothetical protein [Pseudomonas aeruginosa]